MKMICKYAMVVFAQAFLLPVHRVSLSKDIMCHTNSLVDVNVHEYILSIITEIISEYADDQVFDQKINRRGDRQLPSGAPKKS